MYEDLKWVFAKDGLGRRNWSSRASGNHLELPAEIGQLLVN